MSGFPFKIVFDDGEEYAIGSYNDLQKLQLYCQKWQDWITNAPKYSEIAPVQNEPETPVQEKVIDTSIPDSSEEERTPETPSEGLTFPPPGQRAIDYMMRALLEYRGTASILQLDAKMLRLGWPTRSDDVKKRQDILRGLPRNYKEFVERRGDYVRITPKGREEIERLIASLADDDWNENGGLQIRETLPKDIDGEVFVTSEDFESVDLNSPRSSNGFSQADYIEEALKKIGHPARANEIASYLSPDFPVNTNRSKEDIVRWAVRDNPRFTRIERGIYTLSRGFENSQSTPELFPNNTFDELADNAKQT